MSPVDDRTEVAIPPPEPALLPPKAKTEAGECYARAFVLRSTGRSPTDYNPRSVDDRIGDLTMAAVRRYQRANDLPKVI